MALATLAIGCSGGPESPGGPSSPPSGAGLQPGVYAISFTGFDLSNTPSIEPCSPLGVPRNGKRVGTTVRLERAGSSWRIRGENPGDTTFMLHLAVDDGLLSSRPVTGNVQGTLVDAG